MDQNFEKMDGIVNPDYYKTTSPAPPSIIGTLNNNPNGFYRNDSLGYDSMVIQYNKVNSIDDSY